MSWSTYWLRSNEHDRRGSEAFSSSLLGLRVGMCAQLRGVATNNAGFTAWVVAYAEDKRTIVGFSAGIDETNTITRRGYGQS
jgi:hypothetical protein